MSHVETEQNRVAVGSGVVNKASKGGLTEGYIDAPLDSSHVGLSV